MGDQEEMGMDALQSMTDYEVMLDFFPEQCTVGPPADAPQEVQDAMCKNCIGDCQRGDGEPYMGYVGSLRCLMEGAGDIGHEAIYAAGLCSRRQYSRGLGHHEYGRPQTCVPRRRLCCTRRLQHLQLRQNSITHGRCCRRSTHR